MKKSAKILLILFVIAVLAGAAVIIALNPRVPDTGYEETVDALTIMDNTRQTALPQTEVYDIIMDHFNSPLTEGKKKKAIVIGYDGCRADALSLICDDKASGVADLLNDGGHAVFSYCGGVNMPEKNTQDTSTAPGWCSMLTGKWADVHGVYENYQPKEVEPKTLLISLIEEGKIDSSAFYVSWPGHFSKNSATYINELNYIEQNKLNSVFLKADDDDGTKANVLADINKAECSDFIFLTLEYTDHNGHTTGFSIQNPKYVDGFYSADETGAQIIQAIKSRPSFDKEDWLILITTDHGGIKRNHGGPSVQERITFIVSNKEITQ